MSSSKSAGKKRGRPTFVDVTTLRGRLGFYAQTRYGSVKALAKAIDADEGTLGGYDDDKWPAGAVLLKLYKDGCYPGWLLTGHGEMMAEYTPLTPLSPKEEVEQLVEGAIASMERVKDLLRDGSMERETELYNTQDGTS